VDEGHFHVHFIGQSKSHAVPEFNTGRWIILHDLPTGKERLQAVQPTTRSIRTKTHTCSLPLSQGIVRVENVFPACLPPHEFPEWGNPSLMSPLQPQGAASEFLKSSEVHFWKIPESSRERGKLVKLNICIPITLQNHSWVFIQETDVYQKTWSRKFTVALFITITPNGKQPKCPGYYPNLIKNGSETQEAQRYSRLARWHLYKAELSEKPGSLLYSSSPSYIAEPDLPAAPPVQPFLLNWNAVSFSTIKATLLLGWYEVLLTYFFAYAGLQLPVIPAT
jgi:hypothetical protein